MNGTPDCPVIFHEYQISQGVLTGRTKIHSRSHLTNIRRLSRKLCGKYEQRLETRKELREEAELQTTRKKRLVCFIFLANIRSSEMLRSVDW